MLEQIELDDNSLLSVRDARVGKAFNYKVAIGIRNHWNDSFTFYMSDGEAERLINILSEAIKLVRERNG